MEKVTLSNAERQRRFKEKNPKIVEFYSICYCVTFRTYFFFSELGNSYSKNAVKMCQNYFMFCFEPIQG